KPKDPGGITIILCTIELNTARKDQVAVDRQGGQTAGVFGAFVDCLQRQIMSHQASLGRIVGIGSAENKRGPIEVLCVRDNCLGKKTIDLISVVSLEIPEST